MTISDLDAMIQKVCPIFGVDSNGNISFDPSATPQQQQSAKDIVTSNLNQVNAVPMDVAVKQQALSGVNTFVPNPKDTDQNRIAALEAVIVNLQKTGKIS